MCTAVHKNFADVVRMITPIVGVQCVQLDPGQWTVHCAHIENSHWSCSYMQCNIEAKYSSEKIFVYYVLIIYIMNHDKLRFKYFIQGSPSNYLFLSFLGWLFCLIRLPAAMVAPKFDIVIDIDPWTQIQYKCKIQNTQTKMHLLMILATFSSAGFLPPSSQPHSGQPWSKVENRGRDKIPGEREMVMIRILKRWS